MLVWLIFAITLISFPVFISISTIFWGVTSELCANSLLSIIDMISIFPIIEVSLLNVNSIFPEIAPFGISTFIKSEEISVIVPIILLVKVII